MKNESESALVLLVSQGLESGFIRVSKQFQTALLSIVWTFTLAQQAVKLVEEDTLLTSRSAVSVEVGIVVGLTVCTQVVMSIRPAVGTVVGIVA